jgi:hypothetical protein
LCFNLIDCLKTAVQDLHVKPSSAPGDCLSDAAHSNNANSGMVNILSAQHKRSPGSPNTRSNFFIRFNHPARNSHKERPGEVGSGFGQHAWRMTYDDVSFPGCGNVNIVISDCHLRNNLQLRRRLNKMLIHLIA